MKLGHLLIATLLIFTNQFAFAADDEEESESRPRPSSGSSFGSGSAKMPTNSYTNVSTPQGSQAASVVNGLNTAGTTCQKRAAFARTVCIDSMEISKAIPIVSTLTAAAAGMANACSKMGEALKIANTALTAYNVACSSAKYACDMACSKATTQVGSAQTQLTTMASREAAAQAATPVASADLALVMGAGVASSSVSSSSTREIAALSAECKGHQQRLISAGAGLLAIIAEAKKANSCKEETNVAEKETVDCTLATNQTNIVCICAKTPNAAGCSTASTGTSGPNYQAISSGAGDALTGVGEDGTVDLSTNSADSISPSGSRGSSLAAGGGMGGDSGRGGPLSGGSMGGGAGKSADGKKLNTNVLSGYEGGGGGGGRGGSGSGSGSEYDKYLPGAEKDPSRNVASQVFANGEVTGGGGKSNWEKVTERYRDNRSNLMTGP